MKWDRHEGGPATHHGGLPPVHGACRRRRRRRSRKGKASRWMADTDGACMPQVEGRPATVTDGCVQGHHRASSRGTANRPNVKHATASPKRATMSHEETSCVDPLRRSPRPRLRGRSTYHRTRIRVRDSGACDTSTRTTHRRVVMRETATFDARPMRSLVGSARRPPSLPTCFVETMVEERRTTPTSTASDRRDGSHPCPVEEGPSPQELLGDPLRYRIAAIGRADVQAGSRQTGTGGVRPIDIWRRSIDYPSRSRKKDRDWMDEHSGIGGTTNTLVRFCERKTHAPAVPLSRTKEELKKDGDSKDVVVRS